MAKTEPVNRECSPLERVPTVYLIESVAVTGRRQVGYSADLRHRLTAQNEVSNYVGSFTVRNERQRP
jgi:hypothetical protein